MYCNRPYPPPIDEITMRVCLLVVAELFHLTLSSIAHKYWPSTWRGYYEEDRFNHTKDSREEDI